VDERAWYHCGMNDQDHLREAIALSRAALEDDVGGPFGAVVVHAGTVIGRGRNRVLADADPTAHAEVVAIRAACTARGTHDLSGCTVYASCEPCPMCLSALYWAGVDRVVFAATREDAAAIDFQDEDLYREIAKPVAARNMPMENALREPALAVMRDWYARPDRKPY